MKAWHLYLVRCGDDTLYTGIATDVERRFAMHVEGKGAKYLRGRGPLELAFQTPVGTRSEALKLELRVKALSRQQKMEVIAKLFTIDQLVG